MDVFMSKNPCIINPKVLREQQKYAMLPEAKVRKQKDHSNYRSVILASVLRK